MGVLLVTGGAFVFMVASIALIEGVLWMANLLGAYHELGIDTQQSHNYAFTSGYGPMMITALGFSGALLTVWKHINCEYPGCPWPGHRHPDHGRPVCTKHYHADVVPPRTS